MPIRVGSTPPSSSPASSTASWAAATQSWMSRAMYLRLLRSSLMNRALARAGCFRKSKSRISAPRSIGQALRPGTPAEAARPPGPRSGMPRSGRDESPRGVTRPRPVMTTRRSEPSMNDSSISARSGLGRHPVQRPRPGRPTIMTPGGHMGDRNSTQTTNFPLIIRTFTGEPRDPASVAHGIARRSPEPDRCSREPASRCASWSASRARCWAFARSSTPRAAA